MTPSNRTLPQGNPHENLSVKGSLMSTWDLVMLTYLILIQSINKIHRHSVLQRYTKILFSTSLLAFISLHPPKRQIRFLAFSAFFSKLRLVFNEVEAGISS